MAACTFLASFIVMFLRWLFEKMGIMEVDALFPWTIATSFLLLFAIAVNISGLRSEKNLTWTVSKFSFMALALLNGIAARIFSGIPLDEAGSFKFIYLVVAVGFLVFFTIITMMKSIVAFAEKEEWNNPQQKGK